MSENTKDMVIGVILVTAMVACLPLFAILAASL